MKNFRFLFIVLLFANFAFSQNAWINELHYDNVSGDVGEFVEIVIENPGTYTLSDFQVDLYNGSSTSGASYNSQTVDLFIVGNTIGNYTFYYWEPTSIQNGAPDGLALSHLGTVITGQFLSYEGSFTATDGPAIGLTSTDIGVAETSSTPVGESLQLGGTGTQYSDFTWNSPAAETKGIINNGQTFSGGSLSTINVTPTLLSGFSYVVGLGPSGEQSFDISGSDLTADISITPPANYEISLGTGGSFVPTDPIILVHSGGVVSSTSIYVRLKAGLVLGEYNGENITATSTGADDKTVTCNGAVVKPEPTNHATSFSGILGNPAYYYVNLSWVDASGSTEPDGYLIKRSSVDFSDIVDPVDGIPELNGFSIQNVVQGTQLAIFTGFSGTTYYYKIYPYTNSASFIDYKIDGAVPQFSISTDNAPTLPITENFDYTIGSILTDNGWIAHSGVGTNPIQVGGTTLTYPDYVNSGLGNSVTMTTTGEDVNRAFNGVSSGSIYASFMVNISSAQLGGNYIFHFAPENSTFLFYGKVFVQKDEFTDDIAFGVAKRNTGDAVYTSFSYALNTTYLVVAKYTFNEGTATDDEVELWINPVLDGIEPPSDLSDIIGDDVLALGMFALRQGSTSSSPELVLGGIRIADTWIPEPGATTFALDVTVMDKWNMVSIPGLHPTNQDVTTWWPNLTGQVFEFTTSYQPVTTVVPGNGYWLNNSGAETYNYSAINIVAHDPIAVPAGWSMIGGYENIAPVSSLIPSAGTVLSVFEFGTGYATATDLVPGYGYWINMSEAGTITIPDPPLAKGSGDVVEYIKEDWGKIIITDNTGRSYTLYAVEGEVNLNKYELPPMPPAGMFDIRYGSDRIAEDINSSIQSIEMSGLEYPVIVKVDGMDITLQDVTGNEINENIKSGGEITISNAQINKLMVSGQLIPDVYALEQNYPNPFNPSTVIEFSLPEDVSNVQLTIYDILGQRVAELVNTSLKAGKYSYQWNAGAVSTGMYIYELRADKFVSVKKMVLMK